MGKEPVKIKLSTAILVLVIILLLASISFLIYRNNELKEKAKNIVDTPNILNEKIDTSENNIKVEEKNDITKKNSKLEENDELKNFLSYAGFLNEYNDNEYKDESKNKEEVLTNDKIMISSLFTKLKRKNGYVTYDLTQIKEASKEIFNEDINVEKFVKAKKSTIFYDSKIGAYIDGGGDATYSVYFVKLESQNVSNGVYEVTFLYSYVGEYDLVEGTVGERDCYRTTIKIKENDTYKYSKYQLVSSNMSGKKVGKVKDYETNNTNTQNTTSEILNQQQIKYKEIKKELNGSDVLDITDVIKNSNGTYTLKGKISVVDKSKKEETEYPPRKYNGEYMQITVSGDTKCIYSEDSYDEKTSTVEKVFSKKLAFGNCFNFEFKDDKCISVYEVVVGH